MATSIVLPRITHPVILIPESLKALRELSRSARGALPFETSSLVELRASQINGCSVCVEMHSRELKQAGASDDRIFSVAAWREAPYFSPAERAALALAEAGTRLSDRSNPVPDEIWEEAARHFDERQLAALTLEIALINAWNRLNQLYSGGGYREPTAADPGVRVVPGQSQGLDGGTARGGDANRGRFAPAFRPCAGRLTNRCLRPSNRGPQPQNERCWEGPSRWSG